jgi:hypothetical protein
MSDNIFGCFFKIGFNSALNEEDFSALAESFRKYIWGEKGICDILKKLKHKDYGEDLKLALFQFYVKPNLAELIELKKIEAYRKNEKSVGIPIIVDEVFFNRPEDERYLFLKQSILQKMDALEEVVKKRKLDTDMKKLKSDLENLLG